MWKFSFSLAWKLGLGALTVATALGALGALFSGEWPTALALALLAAGAGWGLERSLRHQQQ
ncbi:MAG TPA: hypothetical protein PLJ24_07915 [Anaerolineae bacterium]|nr:hypothetical protein [Anaerolineae bacterium]HQJ11759.1 hypothetical protein [Anaerolineae bacterium]